MVLTFFRTLQHLRPRQVAYRARYRLARSRPVEPLALAWRPLPPRVRRDAGGPARMLRGPGAIRINNEERPFPSPWELEGARKLWRYNLHYMGWLFELDPGPAREEWILRWIRENPRAAGGTGWEPYPVSLRLFNWCRHYCHSSDPPAPEVVASMGEQAAHLLDRLEFHLDGNHLLENLLALAFAAYVLDARDPAAARARDRIYRLLDEELAAQYLPDGGHYELSPMYHAILLERMLDLLSCRPAAEGLQAAALGRLEATARKALAWMETMTVGGDFALFNDSAYDMAPRAESLLAYGRALLGAPAPVRRPLVSLPASGYHRAEADGITVIFDAGPLAPDHQMGHAQCDMLSFCLWADGAEGPVPVLVHPGNYEYLAGPMRSYCRSTASHNTVQVDGAEQAELWASHRIGRRGYPVSAGAEEEAVAGRVRLRGGHTGFEFLPGRPRHYREMVLGADGLEIRDTVASKGSHAATAYFHLHPDCSLREREGGFDIVHPGGVLAFLSEARLGRTSGWHCPEFGLRLRNQVIVAEFRDAAVFRIISAPTQRRSR